MGGGRAAFSGSPPPTVTVAVAPGPGPQSPWVAIRATRPPFARSPLRRRSHRAGRPPVRKLQRIKLRDTGALVDT